jgi:NADH dehydrogenase FAD-containing subunit
MAVLDHVEPVPNGINGVAQQGPPEPAAHAGNKQHLKSVAANLREVPAYSPRRLRVVTIGAGYSGLTLAHKVQHQHPELASIVDHTIYEVRSELGGTWLVNTYPGVVCDVPSHIYVSITAPLMLRESLAN